MSELEGVQYCISLANITEVPHSDAQNGTVSVIMYSNLK